MDTSNDNVVVLVEGHEQEEAAKNAAAPPEREYRRGNWTLPETMVLIEAKKWVHGERQRLSPENLVRWKRVEDYCWRAGCRRSQNQCNDRWDNLMRDYKKVRAYEHGSRNGGGSSYWEMGRAERKERGLPTNLLREIYEALGEAVEKKTSSSGDGVVFVGSSSSLVDVPLQASPLAQVLPRVLARIKRSTSPCTASIGRRGRGGGRRATTSNLGAAPHQQQGQIKNTMAMDVTVTEMTTTTTTTLVSMT